MKKLCAILLSLIMLLALIPAGAIPVAAATSGATGKCTWVLDGTHLIISGNGAMGNYNSTWDESPWGTDITSVTVKNGVTSIGDYAFYYCSSLTSITIGDSVTSIGDYAFYYCSSLTSITIPDSVTSIGNFAFYSCSSLTTVTIGDSVTSIGDYAFSWCKSLTSVVIPDGVTTIGEATFEYCYSLTSVVIPDSVATIGVAAFAACTAMSCIDVAENNANYSSLGGVLFNKDKTALITCPGGKSGGYTIPNGVTTIGDNAFYRCYSLASVVIPDSVTSIGEFAFQSCQSLLSVVVPDSVTTIESYAFDTCKSLMSVVIGDGVTTIGYSVFGYCMALPSVVIPDNVTTIGNNAFQSCSSLTSITIGDSVTSIGDYAFSYCSSLTDVYYGGSESDKAHMSIGNSNDSLRNATWHYNYCDHIYDNEYDTDCNVCGAIREVSIVPVTFGGNSVSEDVSGLAFQFSVDVIGMTTIQNTVAVYDNATVNGYKLLSMGAIADNGAGSTDIPVVYLFDCSDTAVTYAIRVVNIPTKNYNTVITATPYFVVEIAGVATTLYGEAQTASMNGVMNAN